MTKTKQKLGDKNPMKNFKVHYKIGLILRSLVVMIQSRAAGNFYLNTSLLSIFLIFFPPFISLAAYLEQHLIFD